MSYYLFIPVLLFLMLSCKNSNQTTKESIDSNHQTVTSAEKIVTENSGVQMPADTGQQYFKVAVTKNNQPMARYEGDFPIAMFDEANFNIQFPASKRMLKISHFLILYFKGIAVGSFPVAPSGNEKGKPTIIFTPEKDGAYGIGVSMLSGTVNITKYSPQSVSGNTNAEGKDTDGNNINITATFINVKNNNLNQQ